jgi:hypothetical protein
MYIHSPENVRANNMCTTDGRTPGIMGLQFWGWASSLDTSLQLLQDIEHHPQQGDNFSRTDNFGYIPNKR